MSDAVRLMSGKGKPAFGLDFYTIPKTDIVTSRPRTVKIVDNKILQFVDKATKDKEWVPAPNKYPLFFEWKNPKELHKKGHFSKQPRVTSTESIMKNPQVKAWPGPATYKALISDFDHNEKK